MLEYCSKEAYYRLRLRTRRLNTCENSTAAVIHLCVHSYPQTDLFPFLVPVHASYVHEHIHKAADSPCNARRDACRRIWSGVDCTDHRRGKCVAEHLERPNCRLCPSRSPFFSCLPANSFRHTYWIWCHCSSVRCWTGEIVIATRGEGGTRGS